MPDRIKDFPSHEEAKIFVKLNRIEVIRVWVLVGIRFKQKIARQLAQIRNPENLTLGVGGSLLIESRPTGLPRYDKWRSNLAAYVVRK